MQEGGLDKCKTVRNSNYLDTVRDTKEGNADTPTQLECRESFRHPHNACV